MTGKALAQDLINLGHGHKALGALKLIEAGATPEEVFAFLEPQLARAVVTLHWVEETLGPVAPKAKELREGANA